MSNFAYGDSCQTGDDKYVIAQFRSDASLGWVHELRSFLGVGELKYKWFEPRRHHVQPRPDLWRRVSSGVYEAEITIVDPRVYVGEAIAYWLEQQAEPGIDFDESTIRLQSSLQIIAESPLRIASLSRMDWQSDSLDVSEGGDFSPLSLAKHAGGKLKDAITLAARSHAMISPSQTAELVSAGAFGGLGLFDFEKFGSMHRIFDREHSKSIPILNEFHRRLEHGVGRRRFLRELAYKETVSEAGSQGSDHIQAADMAAGWAVDILIFTNGDYRALAQKFPSVVVNGVIVPA